MAGSETPSRMNNADFRQLLSTPRAQQPATPSRFAKYDPNYVPEFKKPELPVVSGDKKKKKYFPKKTEEQKVIAAGYVDRATLRREGKVDENADDGGDAMDISHLISPEEARNLSDAERRALEIERSKYFGGSEQTTHMVKGLDYALLAKVKEDLAKKEREAEIQEKAEKNSAAGDKASNFSRVISTEGQAHEVESISEFKTFIGKSVFDVIFRKSPETVDHFLPGRTSFVFDLDPDSISDIPTIVKRSKDDLPVGRELMVPVTHPDLMSKITAIMVYFHQGAKAYKKLKKKEKKEKDEKHGSGPGESSARETETVEVEDSIFGDVSMSGVYIPKISPAKDVDSYDSRSSSILHISGTRHVVSSEEAAKERLSKLLAHDDDGYGEAYPSLEGMSYAAIDDDDDHEGDDLLKIDTRQNLKRHEFESDEAWAEHQSQREAIPKAAFQFGVKVKDGRQKKAFAEQKLKKQLRAVEDIIEQKQGHKISGFEDHGDDGDRKPKKRYDSFEKTPRTLQVDANSYDSRLAQKRKAAEGSGEESPAKKYRYDS